jgi:polyisoprenoid-binding protein YceI
MTRFFLSFFFLLFLAAPLAHAGAQRYHFDKDHTTILFFVNHLGFSNKIGRFTDYEGTLLLDEDFPEKSSVQVTLRPKGIDTDSQALNKVLQGKSWFNAEAYPTITFRSTQIKQQEDNKNKAEVSGWMTMLGKENFVTLNVTFNKSGVHPITKAYVAGFSADAEINRSDFGMNNSVPFVGEDVRLHIESEFIRE